jgi:hypothetical protein
MCNNPPFNWLEAFWIPLAMTVVIGGGVGFFASLYCGRMLLFQQLISNAVGYVMELGPLAITGDFNDAVVGCRTTHIKIRACSLALLLQGHLEAAKALKDLCGESETSTEDILDAARAKFRGKQSNGAEIRSIEDALNESGSKFATRIAKIKTPWWRNCSWRMPTPS